MERIVGSFGLYQALKAEGFELPKECAEVRMEMPVDGIFQLVYRVNLTEEDLKKIGRTLVRMAEGRSA